MLSGGPQISSAFATANAAGGNDTLICTGPAADGTPVAPVAGALTTGVPSWSSSTNPAGFGGVVDQVDALVERDERRCRWSS